MKIPIINKKVLCILNTSHLFINNYLKNVVPLKKRYYDIAFLGTINYGTNSESAKILTNHRTELCKKLSGICEKHKLNYIVQPSISLKKYNKVLQQTKIFVSPYGWGEWSLKDYECICNGCHVIKPNIYYKSIPNYYENMDHYNDDLEKLEPLILDLLNPKNINDIQEKVNKNRELFVQYDDDKIPLDFLL